MQGTGRGGLITVDDVVAATSPSASVTALRSTLATQRGIGVISSSAASAAKLAASGRGHNATAVEPEKLRGLRRSMAQSMSLARDNVTSCTIFDDADLHRWGVGQDVTTRLLRGIAVGCKAEPGLNAWLDDTAHSRLLLSRVDVGIAVDTPEGLIAPVVRDVGGRSAAQLRQDINRLKRTARDRSIGAEDLKDFTFMLSNFGMIAGRYATPVVVPPAVAILGAGRLTPRRSRRHGSDRGAPAPAAVTHLRSPQRHRRGSGPVHGGAAGGPGTGNLMMHGQPSPDDSRALRSIPPARVALIEKISFGRPRARREEVPGRLFPRRR